jgi:predicted transcriptional regulator
MEIMVEKEMGRLLVIEPEAPELLVGIISRGDILKFYEDHTNQEGGVRP